MSRIAIIPARGGSKRIPRKNIRHFHGRPIILYSIAAAQASGLFDEIWVSSEDQEIMSVAQSAGAKPLWRTVGLEADEVGTQRVMQDALVRLVPTVRADDYACCIYPTAPMMTAGDLLAGFAALTKTDWDPTYAMSVTAYPSPPQHSLWLAEGSAIVVDWPEDIDRRTQDLKPRYHDAGQWYWGRTSAFQRGEPLYSPATLGVPVPRVRAVDINTEEDWRLAELLYAALNNGKSHP